MGLCSYCDQEKNLVRENLIPAWYYEHEPAWDEPGRARGWTVRTDLQVDDICQDCHDRLAGPAHYARQLFQQQLVHYLYRDTERGFEPDYEPLVRWLLRISYDCARLHGEELGILAQYRDVMLGEVAVPPALSVWLRTVTPTALDGEDIRAHSGAQDVAAYPDWLRIGVVGIDNCGCVSWTFRQVAINSYAFLLLLPDPTRLEDAQRERIEHTEAVDAQMQGACWLGPGSNIWTPAPWGDALESTLQSIGCLHLGCERVQSQAIAEAMGTDGPVEYRIERFDIEAGNITHALAFLCELVATKETCLRMRQRVELSIVGYEDDPLGVHEHPEVGAFLRALDQSFPFWMFFQHPEGLWLQKLSVLLANPTRNESGKFQLDAELMGEKVRGWFTAHYNLCYLYGIAEEVAVDVATAAQHILMPAAGRS